MFLAGVVGYVVGYAVGLCCWVVLFAIVVCLCCWVVLLACVAFVLLVY